jgi:hypothetical protein
MRKALYSGLPRYVLPELRKGGRVVYSFNVPTWARKAGCPLKNERLAPHEGAVCLGADRDRLHSVPAIIRGAGEFLLCQAAMQQKAVTTS